MTIWKDLEGKSLSEIREGQIPYHFSNAWAPRKRKEIPKLIDTENKLAVTGGEGGEWKKQVHRFVFLV